MALVPIVRPDKRPDDSLAVSPRPKRSVTASGASVLRLLLVTGIVASPFGRHLAWRLRPCVSIRRFSRVARPYRAFGTDMPLRADLVVSSLTGYRPTDQMLVPELKWQGEGRPRSGCLERPRDI